MWVVSDKALPYLSQLRLSPFRTDLKNCDPQVHLCA
jgi:hypothetical protein